MEGATAGLSVLAELRRWLSTIRDGTRQRQERFAAVVNAVLHAVGTTRHYLTDQREGAPRDRAVERELTRLWMDASVQLSPFNPDLARRCELKGEYWTDPHRWTREQVIAARVEIDRVTTEARDLLRQLRT